METLWASQSYQAEHVVLRLRLRPYSCGHEANLSLIQSPFLFGGSPGLSDLLTAALLCSHTFEQGQALIRKPRKARLMCRAWGWLLFRVNLSEELNRFRGYLHAGCWSPETARVISPGLNVRTLKAPRIYRLIPFLCSRLNLTESQAMNFPMARAHAYYAAMADKAGEIDLVDGDDPLLEHLAELEARAEKGEKVWGC